MQAPSFCVLDYFKNGDWIKVKQNVKHQKLKQEDPNSLYTAYLFVGGTQGFFFFSFWKTMEGCLGNTWMDQVGAFV